MNYRHINRGRIREGGCPLCKPVMKRSDWTMHYFGEHPRVTFDYEESAEGFHDPNEVTQISLTPNPR